MLELTTIRVKQVGLLSPYTLLRLVEEEGGKVWLSFQGGSRRSTAQKSGFFVCLTV